MYSQLNFIWIDYISLQKQKHVGKMMHLHNLTSQRCLSFAKQMQGISVSSVNCIDYIIMDNASIHKSKKTQDLIESKKAKLKFQPPYSPFLNKIENYWGFIKREIGLIKKNYEKLDDYVKAVFGMEYVNKNNCNIKVS